MAELKVYICKYEYPLRVQKIFFNLKSMKLHCFYNFLMGIHKFESFLEELETNGRKGKGALPSLNRHSGSTEKICALYTLIHKHMVDSMLHVMYMTLENLK